MVMDAVGGAKPKISIIIPVFNREHLVPRAIRSCLAQTQPEFEIIVVDDGSTDGSREAVRQFDDPRIRLYAQARNTGVGTARNHGVAKARADWIAFLDSDDELVPEALATVVEKIEESGSDVAALWFRCRCDNGTIVPSSIPKMGRVDLKQKLLFHEACVGKSDEVFHVCRRTTFSNVRFPSNRGLEELYFLNFSKHYLGRICPEVLRLYHQDADNQISRSVGRVNHNRDLQFVFDRMATLEEVLFIYGEDIRRYGPGIYRRYVSQLLTLKLLLGDRLGAFALLRPASSAGVGFLRIFTVSCLGFVHSSFLAAAQGSSLWQRLRDVWIDSWRLKSLEPE
jgi:glycosyltransferase involved in cell wall biosynthesis